MNYVIRAILTALICIIAIPISLLSFAFFEGDDYCYYSMAADKYLLREIQEFLGTTFPEQMQISEVTATTPFFDGDSTIKVRIYSNLSQEEWNELLNMEHGWTLKTTGTRNWIPVDQSKEISCRYVSTPIRNLFGQKGYVEIWGRAKKIDIRCTIYEKGKYVEDAKMLAELMRVLLWVGVIIVLWLPYGDMMDYLMRPRRTCAEEKEENSDGRNE